MRCRSSLQVLIATLCLLLLAAPVLGARARRNTVSHEPKGHLTFASPQSSPLALGGDGRLYVAATTSDRVDVFDTSTLDRVATVAVGLDPVSVAARPGAPEVWVSNHVSDSVSVIDTDPGSTSFLRVVETVQDVDSSSLVTRFDEPVGIAFSEDGAKAYVALSSRNEIAVVDAASYSVVERIAITAQEPRALAVRNGHLYVAAFESSNQTELSACETDQNTVQCSLGGQDLLNFAQSPNLPGEEKNIVVDPDLPDRDLFVIDTSTDQVVDVASGVGTLLYGVAPASDGRVFVSQADARNAANGLHGSNLIDLENRMFFNRIAELDCSGGSCGTPSQIELEPALPQQPAPGDALATPYGIAVSEDGSTLVATAAASSRMFTLDTATGAVQARLDVGAIPRGLALASDPTDGSPLRAYVLNTLGNSLSVVDVSDPASPLETATLSVGNDPTPDAVRRGRIAFNNAKASTSNTFACASCHPDGHTDQVLWRIGGACFFGNCSGNDEPRSTMPIRGLRDTLPLHWDGTLGDPFGGPNGATGSGGSEPPNCDGSDRHTCFVQLVEASQIGVMCDQSVGCGLGDNLTSAQRDDMGTFLESVSYPPARSRRPDDQLTASAVQGFEDFFMDQGSQIGATNPNTCADSDAGCHELPLGNATNSETLEAFDAPTMRGMTDRFLQFSNGITNTQELLLASNDGANLGFITGPPNAFPWDPQEGYEENTTFGVAFGIFTPTYNVGPEAIFEMFEQASTGPSGATGQQVTLNTRTTNGSALAGTEDVLATLEQADGRGVVNLRGKGLLEANPRTISYDGRADEYQVGSDTFTHSELISEAQSGRLLATLTGHLRRNVREGNAQPLIAPPGAKCGTGMGSTGDPALPVVSSGSATFALEAKYVSESSRLFVDGSPVTGTITLLGGSATCSEGVTPDPIEVSLQSVPAVGTHVLQVQSGGGLLSNELPFVVE